MEPETTADLRAARAGDRAAFARVHGRWHRVVHGVLLSRLPPQDAEELVQEGFVTAWLRLPDLVEVAAFPGWICAIARNRAVDHLRARKLTEPLVFEPAVAGSDHALRIDTLRAIQALPEAYRETLMLRLAEDLSGPEIAAKTGLAEGSVRVNLHRGMAMLRERLGGPS